MYPPPSINQIHYLENRFPVYWAGYNSIKATIELFKTASNYDKFDYYVILQGMDYPIKSNKEIDEFFLENYGTEFIRGVSETSADVKFRHKYCLKYYKDSPNYFQRIKNRLNSFIQKHHLIHFKPPYIKVIKEKYEIFKGSACFAITNDAVEYILKFHTNNKKYNKFFKNVYAADESYFHTIIYNSPFKSKTLLGRPNKPEERKLEQLINLTYFEYPVKARLFLKADEYEYLRNTDCLYFRKASSESKPLLDFIDNQHILIDKNN